MPSVFWRCWLGIRKSIQSVKIEWRGVGLVSCLERGANCLHMVQLRPSVLWRCWLGGRKGIRPVKKWVVGCWRGCLSGARSRLSYGPADATASQISIIFILIQTGFTFLVLAHPGSPGQRAVKRVCVWCTQVFIPRIFQKELNIGLAGYPPALAGGYPASVFDYEGCTAVVCEAACCMEVRPGL